MYNTRKNITYFIYARKSSESDEKQVQSIEDQVRIMTDLAKSYGIKVKEIFTESKTAKEPHARAIFEKMIKKIENGEADGVLAWKIDRLSRNPIDSATIQWMLQKEIIQSILTPDREYRSEDNALILSVESSMANQYIRDLSKNVKRGLQSKLDKGWMPTTAPIGYLNTITQIRGENYIIKDPERFDQIRKIWDMMLTGNYLPSQILLLINTEWNFTTKKTAKRGGTGIARSTLYRILTNPFYAGIVEYGGRVIQGKHPQMVTIEEFDAVQLRLGKEGKPRPKSHVFAFTGCFRCAECGCSHTAMEKTKLIKSTGEVKNFTYYFCTRRSKLIKCNQKSYLEVRKLEKQIELELEKYEIHPLFRDWALEILREKNDKEIGDSTKTYEMQQASLNKSQGQLDNLTRMRYSDLINDAEFSTERVRLQEEIMRVKEQLKNTEDRADKWLELTERTFTFATYARTKFINGDLQTKKEILKCFGLNPTIKDKKLLIEANKWFVEVKTGVLPLMKELAMSEPGKILVSKRQKEAFASLRPIMRGQAGSNRQPLA